MGLLLGRVDFQDLALNLGGAVEIKYGLFIQSTLDFLIIALVLFLVIRAINRIAPKKPEDMKPADKSPELQVLEDIRDTLKKN